MNKITIGAIIAFIVIASILGFIFLNQPPKDPSEEALRQFAEEMSEALQSESESKSIAELTTETTTEDTQNTLKQAEQLLGVWTNQPEISNVTPIEIMQFTEDKVRIIKYTSNKKLFRDLYFEYEYTVDGNNITYYKNGVEIEKSHPFNISIDKSNEIVFNDYEFSTMRNLYYKNNKINFDETYVNDILYDEMKLGDLISNNVWCCEKEKNILEFKFHDNSSYQIDFSLYLNGQIAFVGRTKFEFRKSEIKEYDYTVKITLNNEEENLYCNLIEEDGTTRLLFDKPLIIESLGMEIPYLELEQE